MATAETTAPPRPDVVLGDNPSPNDIFIAEHVEPQYADFRTWRTAFGNFNLLKRAARHLHVHVKRAAGPDYVLMRSGRAIGSLYEGVCSSLISAQAWRATLSRQLLYRYLEHAELPLPSYRVVTLSESSRTAAEVASSFTFPVAVQPNRNAPTSLRAIRTENSDDLEKNLWAVYHSEKNNNDSLPRVAVTQWCEGLDLRIFVIREEIAGAQVRVPFYLLGDGRRTAEELFDAEAAFKSRSVFYSKRIPDKEQLFSGDSTGETIPPRGKLFYPTESTDARGAGSLTVEVVEQLAEDLQSLAIDAVWAIPGLTAAEVNIRVPRLDSAEDAHVVNVDPRARLSEYAYPTYGKKYRVHSKIIETIIERSS